MSEAEAQASSDDKALRGIRIASLVGAIICVGFIALFALPGSSGFIPSSVTVFYLALKAGLPAALWLIGARGIGRFVLNSANSRALAPQLTWILEFSLGVVVCLFLTHTLGWLGVFWTPAGRILSWGLPIACCACLIMSHRNSAQEHGRLRVLVASSLVLIPVSALLLVCASSPPGALWASEAHGYDVLSYHLQLVKEWHSTGHINPLLHNVYSYFPSYVESAYAQLAAMLVPHATSIIAGDALPLHAAQFLHAGLTILSALGVGQLCSFVCAQARERPSPSRAMREIAPAAIAAAALIATPWVIVVGSLAYNEGAVLLCFIGALAACFADLKLTNKALLIGCLVAGATGAKLTAIPWVGIPVAVLLLSSSPIRTWPKLILFGSIGAACVLAPWIARNAVNCANPLFPLASSLWCECHWTAEQASRWASGHTPEGSFLHRLGLLFSERGMLHPQWSVFFPLVGVSMFITLFQSIHRRLGVMISIVIVMQLAMWLLIGHQQSRFLLPTIVPGSLLIGLAVDGLLTTRSSVVVRSLVLAAAAAAVLAQCVSSVTNFLGQRENAPNSLLIGGVRAIRGEGLADQLRAMNSEDREHILTHTGTEAFINQFIAPQSNVLLALCGDATPLYYAAPIIYNTTWDDWLFATSLQSAGGDFEMAIDNLRSRGVTHFLINLNEISRLESSGWLDPRLSTDLAVSFVQSQPHRVVRAWTQRGRGQFLLDLRHAPSTPVQTSLPGTADTNH